VRVAVLDDHQGVALSMADWSPVSCRARIDVFHDHVVDTEALVERLAPYEVVVLMRERTPLPAEVVSRLPRLRLVVTTGARNGAIDLEATRAHGVVVSGTGSLSSAPAELTWALVLALLRHLETEVGNVRRGGWQTTVGRDLAGSTLGVVGLGRVGSRVAAVGRAFGMEVLAWSAHLTPERAAAVGAQAVGFEELLGRSDVVTVHQVLSDRTRGLVDARAIDRMRPGACLVNTSRAAIVDTRALVAALDRGHLAGAALDVLDEEPLPAGSPLRTHPRLLVTPHLGYVTEAVYRRFYAEVVEDIAAFLDGTPLRTL
jgi:phosphoglycerate dehydrogenase-like enzyme